ARTITCEPHRQGGNDCSAGIADRDLVRMFGKPLQAAGAARGKPIKNLNVACTANNRHVLHPVRFTGNIEVGALLTLRAPDGMCGSPQSPRLFIFLGRGKPFLYRNQFPATMDEDKWKLVNTKAFA